MGNETALNSVKHAFLNIKRVTDTECKFVDVFDNVKHVLKFVNMITNNLNASKLELRATCSFLSTLLQKEQYSLENITKLSDQRTAYSQIDDSSFILWSTAVSLEVSLIRSNRYLTNMDKDTSSDVINTIQDTISEKDIVKFLSTLETQAKELIRKSEVKSSCRACPYVNLYTKIAILHSFVLWQVFCIKRRSAYDKSSTNGVFSMIESSRIYALEMLKCITHPNMKNAVFLSVFHFTKNENVLHFLEIHGIKTFVFDESFYDQRHYIVRDSPPCLRLQMKPLSFAIYGTETSEGCEFIFESVNEQKLDNVCYIRSAQLDWKNYYIQMKSNGSCVAVKNKPEVGGKWKCVFIMNGKRHETFIISSIDWPGMFLYLSKSCAKGQTDLKKVMEEGRWRICGTAWF